LSYSWTLCSPVVCLVELPATTLPSVALCSPYQQRCALESPQCW
jgi:hypothetical protein